MTPMFGKGRLYKEWLFLFFLFLISGFTYYALVYTPVGRQIKGIRAENERLGGEAAGYRNLVSNAKKEAGRLEEVVTAYEGVKEKLLLIKERLPSTDEVSGILKEVVSHQPGITFISVQSSAIEAKGSYLRLPLSLQLRGDFPSFGGFLSRLEGSRRLVGVENISIVRDGKPGLLIKLELSVYLISGKT